MQGVDKKLIEAHTLAEPDDEDGFAKGCALIRSNLCVDIDKVETEEEWAALYGQVVWLERWHNNNLTELIVGLFGEKRVNPKAYRSHGYGHWGCFRFFC